MGVELTGGDWLDRNRANWDERVPVHVAAPMYDRARLREGGSLLDPIAAAGIARLFPDGLDGVRVLHLQCHFGSDTLSLVNAGATAVGLDFSRPAVEEARRMAEELGVADRARFVEANVYDARHRLPEPESFDLVFTTWGTIGWLPDGRLLVSERHGAEAFEIHPTNAGHRAIADAFKAVIPRH